MQPYYQDESVTIWNADCRAVLPLIAPGTIDLVLTDPPYGISHRTGHIGAAWRGTEIAGDSSTEVRDVMLQWWGKRPALVFGSCKASPPSGHRMALVWDKGELVGMGDLSLPWKPNWEHIYVFGSGFSGHRGSGVLHFPAIAPVLGLYVHPNEKPIPLLKALLLKAPNAQTILDPFMGSGTTLRAAKDLGRKAIGIEISEAYCEIAARRMSQLAMELVS